MYTKYTCKMLYEKNKCEYIYIYICPADVLPQKKGKHINNIDLDLLYSYIGVRHLCNEQTSLKRSMNRHMTRK